jgi:hypothetical protein
MRIMITGHGDTPASIARIITGKADKAYVNRILEVNQFTHAGQTAQSKGVFPPYSAILIPSNIQCDYFSHSSRAEVAAFHKTLGSFQDASLSTRKKLYDTQTTAFQNIQIIDSPIDFRLVNANIPKEAGPWGNSIRFFRLISQWFGINQPADIQAHESSQHNSSIKKQRPIYTQESFIALLRQVGETSSAIRPDKSDEQHQ